MHTQANHVEIDPWALQCILDGIDRLDIKSNNERDRVTIENVVDIMMGDYYRIIATTFRNHLTPQHRQLQRQLPIIQLRPQNKLTPTL